MSFFMVIALKPKRQLVRRNKEKYQGVVGIKRIVSIQFESNNVSNIGVLKDNINEYRAKLAWAFERHSSY